jgi:hypothetical protein
MGDLGIGDWGLGIGDWGLGKNKEIKLNRSQKKIKKCYKMK